MVVRDLLVLFSRDMEWFDTKVGMEGDASNSESDGPVGAGGLMAKFNR